jgi:hypothetical protein
VVELCILSEDPKKEALPMFMKKMLSAMFLSILVLVTAFPCPAEEEKPEKTLSGELSLSALSAYIWHGQELSRHSVVLQPSLTFQYKGFSATAWGNWDSGPYMDGTDRLNEEDYSVSYEGGYGLLTYGIGYLYYDVKDADDSQEVSLKLGLDVPLNPTLTVYREVGHGLYWYFLMGASHSFPLSDRLALDLSASAGYLISTDADKYPEIDGSGNETGQKYNNLLDGTLTASLPYKVMDNITVTPTLSYTFPLGDAARREMKFFSLTGNDSSFLYGGVIVTFSF